MSEITPPTTTELRAIAEAAQTGPWIHVAVRNMQHEVFTPQDEHMEGASTICCWHAADAAEKEST